MAATPCDPGTGMIPVPHETAGPPFYSNQHPYIGLNTYTHKGQSNGLDQEDFVIWAQRGVQDGIWKDMS